MKYKIQWQDRWGNWQHYQTKTNEADAFHVMKQMVKQKEILVENYKRQLIIAYRIPSERPKSCLTFMNKKLK